MTEPAEIPVSGADTGKTFEIHVVVRGVERTREGPYGAISERTDLARVAVPVTERDAWRIFLRASGDATDSGEMRIPLLHGGSVDLKEAWDAYAGRRISFVPLPPPDDGSEVLALRDRVAELEEGLRLIADRGVVADANGTWSRRVNQIAQASLAGEGIPPCA